MRRNPLQKKMNPLVLSIRAWKMVVNRQSAILFIISAALFVYGSYRIHPTASLFVAGVMLILVDFVVKWVSK